jgi:IclR family acetate operon transcriptional repressor
MQDVATPDEAEKGGTDPTRERSGVQSIERAFGILTQIARNPDGISLAELSKSVGLHTSTTFHIVRTMTDIGAVRQDRGTKRYHLGRLVFALAASSSREIDLVATATPFIERLAQDTGESSHLGLRSGDKVVLAARIAGSGAFQLVERAGAFRPPHCTALGKVLLASLPDSQLSAFIDRLELVPSTTKSITDKALLRAEIDRVRAAKVGFDDAEFDEEVRCVAAPVYDYSGQVVAAIGVSGPIWRMNLQRMEQVTRRVREVAADLSEELGYSQA